jgi:hypothetical protein
VLLPLRPHGRTVQLYRSCEHHPWERNVRLSACIQPSPTQDLLHYLPFTCFWCRLCLLERFTNNESRHQLASPATLVTPHTTCRQQRFGVAAVALAMTLVKLTFKPVLSPTGHVPHASCGILNLNRNPIPPLRKWGTCMRMSVDKTVAWEANARIALARTGKKPTCWVPTARFFTNYCCQQ